MCRSAVPWVSLVSHRRQDRPSGVLILVQNLPVPFDRRVWQEASALRDSGFDVTVICPTSEQYPATREEIDGVHIHRYRPRLEARSLGGYFLEYAVALGAMTLLAWRVTTRRRIDIVQACNPPDLLFLVAFPLVMLRGARFVFDHHDVSPELLMAKGKAANSWVVRLSRILERLTFGCAVVSIATNESYREVAISRGGMSAEDVFVVRSSPALGFDPVAPDTALKRGRRYMVGYVGVMGVQEGLDLLLEAARLIVAQHGRHDIAFALAGNGPEAKRLRARSEAMGLSGHVYFLGRVSDAELLLLLSTADVCVNPDEVNPMNDISTMNKVVEYMALGRPIVQFDTREGRISASSSSLYAVPNDPASLAEAICRLLDDPELRAQMGARGRERFQEVLSWSRQVPNLLAAYDRALSKGHLDINLRRAGWWRKGSARRAQDDTAPQDTPSSVEEPAGDVMTTPPEQGAHA
jgi:glycosyltransferase involved in cell wall biosynthesis